MAFYSIVFVDIPSTEGYSIFFSHMGGYNLFLVAAMRLPDYFLYFQKKTEVMSCKSQPSVIDGTRRQVILVSTVNRFFVTRILLKDRPFRTISECFDAKKRPNKAVLGPYLQISFCTEFKALSDGIKHL